MFFLFFVNLLGRKLYSDANVTMDEVSFKVTMVDNSVILCCSSKPSYNGGD